MAWVERNRDWLVVALVAAVSFFPRLWEGDLRGDPLRYGAIAKTMVTTGNWLTPQDQPGVLYANKPPLMFWLVALGFRLVGAGTYAAKFWSCLFAVGACVLTCLLARRLLGREVGLLAGAMTATLAGVVSYAVELRLDSAVMFYTVLAVYGVARALQDERPRWLLLAGVAGGLGLMTKPVAAAHVGALSILLLALRRPRWLVHPWFLLAIGLAVALAAPWHVAMAERQGHAFTQTYFGREIGSRLALGAHFFPGLARNVGAFLAYGLPWWPVAAYAVSRWRRASAPERQGMTVALLWIAEVILAMAVPRKRYDRQLMAAYPALALLAGYGASGLLSERARRAVPALLWRLAVATGLLLVLARIPIHWCRRKAYADARPVIDRLEPGDTLAIYDPSCTTGASAHEKQWSVRAAVVYYLDRRLVNYASDYDLLQDLPLFVITDPDSAVMLEPLGYSVFTDLEKDRRLLWRIELPQEAPAGPGGADRAKPWPWPDHGRGWTRS